jgi:hypothetical protein
LPPSATPIRNFLPIVALRSEEENTTGSIDIRIKGNEVNIGGSWGTVDVRAAVHLSHKFRGSKPLLPRLNPYNIGRGPQKDSEQFSPETIPIAESL